MFGFIPLYFIDSKSIAMVCQNIAQANKNHIVPTNIWLGRVLAQKTFYFATVKHIQKMKKLTDKTCLTFKDLLSRFEFEDIRTAFASLWKADCPDKAEQLDLEGWKEIYNKCRDIEPTMSGYYIYLGSRWEHCCPMVDMNCRVLDKSNDERYGPLSWYPSWSEIVP